MELFAARDPISVARSSRVLGRATRAAFRYALHGLDAIPPPPCLFVGNHSGAGVIEVLCMLPAWHARFGESRPVHALANEVSLGYPVIGPWLRSVGALDASYENGLATLRAGRDLLVFPGGDIDSFRPFYEARKVVFGKRRGYVRLALEAGVPIVPLATIGAHHTYLMAPGNTWLAKKLGLKRLVRLESAPMTVGGYGAMLASGAALLSLVDPIVAALAITGAAIPLPVRITSAMRAAIDLPRDLADVPEQHRVERGHEMVFGALAEAVQSMTHDA